MQSTEWTSRRGPPEELPIRIALNWRNVKLLSIRQLNLLAPCRRGSEGSLGSLRALTGIVWPKKHPFGRKFITISSVFQSRPRGRETYAKVTQNENPIFFKPFFGHFLFFPFSRPKIGFRRCRSVKMLIRFRRWGLTMAFSKIRRINIWISRT